MIVGAYAEYISVSVDMLVKKPKEMGWEEAAGIPEVGSIVTDGWVELTISDVDNSNASPLPNRQPAS